MIHDEWKGRRERLSWPILKYYIGLCMERLRMTTIRSEMTTWIHRITG